MSRSRPGRRRLLPAATSWAGISLAAASQAPEAVLRFSDVTAESGIEFRHESSATTRKYLIETMGGGVALLDYDGDGRLDVFFTNGALLRDPMPPGAEPLKHEPRFWNRLFRSNGDGTFTDVTERAGVKGSGYGMGAAVGDYDNDGRPDLYVTSYGTNTLYHNDGGGRFSDVTRRAGAEAGGWSTSAAFVDYDRDGRLDLFVCRYLDWSFADNPYCGDRRPGYREYCHPRTFRPIANRLYRNEGDGRFHDASEAAGIARPGKSLGVAIGDYDDDGWIDLFVANDSVPGFLYRNDGRGAFTEVGLHAGVAYNAEGTAVAGMGAELGDYDNDGRLDLFVTTLSGETYSLYRNGGDGFEFTTTASGVAEASLPFSGWGTKLADFDNDGWSDLFVVQGHVLDTIELTSDHLKYAQPPLLLRGSGGRFGAVPGAGPAFARAWAGRGAAIGDLDNDGDLDIVVGNCGQKAYVLRNDGGSRSRWLAIRLIGTRSNRDGIGARVRVVGADGVTRTRTVSTTGSYLSASDSRVLVGLGSSALARSVEVRWPSGILQRLTSVRAGQELAIREPEAEGEGPPPPSNAGN